MGKSKFDKIRQDANNSYICQIGHSPIKFISAKYRNLHVFNIHGLKVALKHNCVKLNKDKTIQKKRNIVSISQKGDLVLSD